MLLRNEGKMTDIKLYKDKVNDGLHMVQPADPEDIDFTDEDEEE